MSGIKGPSCPVCQLQAAERSPDGDWWCFTCNTLFTGNGGEWEACRTRRERFAGRQKLYARQAAELAQRWSPT